METDQLTRRTQYWRRVRCLTAVLLSIWLTVTLAVPWFARDLSHWTVGQFPIDYWMSAQGAIILYLALVVVYAWMMDRLDARWRAQHSASARSPAVAPPAHHD